MQDAKKNRINMNILLKIHLLEKNIETGNFVKLSNGYTYYESENIDHKNLLVFVHGFSVPSYIWDLTYNEAKKEGMV